jgi:hypothetical protein
MVCKANRVFDPLDLEILERAFEGAWAAFKEKWLASDAEWHALLHRELTEIAAFNGGNDVQSIRDVVNVARMRPAGPLALTTELKPA